MLRQRLSEEVARHQLNSKGAGLHHLAQCFLSPPEGLSHFLTEELWYLIICCRSCRSLSAVSSERRNLCGSADIRECLIEFWHKKTMSSLFWVWGIWFFYCFVFSKSEFVEMRHGIQKSSPGRNKKPFSGPGPFSGGTNLRYSLLLPRSLPPVPSSCAPPF